MRGAGPVKVIPDKAILAAEEESGELVLAALYPGVAAAEVQAGVGWPLRQRPALAPVAPPPGTAPRLLRQILDPQRRYPKGWAPAPPRRARSNPPPGFAAVPSREARPAGRPPAP